MKRLVVNAVLVFSVLSLAGCSGMRRKQPLVRLIPASSFVVVTVNWAAVRRDDDLKRLANGRAVEKILDEIGIIIDSVAELAAYSNGQSSARGASGMLVRGTFNSRTVVNELKRRGWTEETFQRRKLYSNPADADAYLAPLDSHMVVCGTRAGVEGSLNAAADARASFAATSLYGKMSAALPRKQEQYPIVMMVAMPQAAQDATEVALQVTSLGLDWMGVGVLGGLLHKIGYARGLTCTISREGSSFPIELVAVMRDESSASFIAGALGILKGFSTAVPRSSPAQSDQEAAQNLKNLSIQRAHEVLLISLLMARRDLLPADPQP